jgi:Alanine-zipper, major outer membrane lipoprotein
VLISRLVDRATEILEAAGHSPGRAHLDRITATLQASADEGFRDELSGGRLAADLQPTGFGGLADWEALPHPSGTVTKLEPAEVRKARREAEDLVARAESAEERAEALRETAARLRGKAEEAEEAAQAAVEEARSARKRATEGARRLDRLVRKG